MGVYKDVTEFYERYDGVKLVYGKSERGLNLYALKAGKGDAARAIVQAGIHAREYVNAYVLMKMILKYRDFKHAVWFLLLTNPDGADICENGKPLYKANARGVDLNVNFDAGWGTGKYNVRTQGDENYIGEFPFSEKESAAIGAFTLRVKPSVTVSYHTKGEEIYFDFGQTGERYRKDKEIAKAVSEVTGYKIVENLPSAGGYKDWCVEKLGIPSLTIETGKDELTHPVGKEYADEIYAKNELVIERIFERL